MLNVVYYVYMLEISLKYLMVGKRWWVIVCYNLGEREIKIFIFD